ncbi:DUF3019 domain-containing protein [Bowmanella sp. JS7-9]|uniref:DUF3019 domain-containing protein n=1 Tax=Pseudobowmanella zhangzhouensis TaxID=1537679 RepID=A0ABW1XND4_9ALTE|nr:DUF3019 domain-containing protein [Bowmanella sp. JS7-9]TBX20379.1 hypothetical protein TK45_15440 [Bowmanella sp. JS7-9]
MKKHIGWLLLVLLFAPVVDAAQELSITPQTCVLDEQGVCELELAVRFESDDPLAVCIVITAQPSPWCLQAMTLHQLSIALRTSENLTISVINSDDRALLARSELMVAAYVPASSRKRRRFSWSFQ